MPIYEYACDRCGTYTEEYQTMAEQSVPACIFCRQVSYQIMSLPAPVRTSKQRQSLRIPVQWESGGKLHTAYPKGWKDKE